MNRKIRSFKLKKGYQATFATSTDGTDYSRIFIADTEDLYVSELPNILDQGISFIRVLIHDWPSKKGWCEVSRPSMLPNANMLECTWLYNWDAYAARSANIEYVPEKWSTSWPGFSTINSSQNVSHLLSYNEPDHVEQSNITVDQAVNQWPELLKTGLRVGSPATTDFSWLYSFMDKCQAKKYRADSVVPHCYRPSMIAQLSYYDLTAVYD